MDGGIKVDIRNGCIMNLTGKAEIKDQIQVKVSGHELLIHCRHEVRNDEFGTVSREIHRYDRQLDL